MCTDENVADSTVQCVRLATDLELWVSFITSSTSCLPTSVLWPTAEINKTQSTDNSNYAWLTEYRGWSWRGLPSAESASCYNF